VKLTVGDQPHYQDLKNLVRSGRCFAFIGSGLSIGVYPAWGELVLSLCNRCAVPVPDSADPSKVETLMDLADKAWANDATTYHRVLAETFGRLPTTTRRAYDLLMQLPFRGYITTNFDPLLADLCRRHPDRCQDVRVYPGLEADFGASRAFYLHGYVPPGAAPTDHRLVLGKSQFEHAYESSTLRSFLEQLLTFHPVVFIGASLGEPALHKVFDYCHSTRQEIEIHFSGKAKPRYILLSKLYRTVAGEGSEHDVEVESSEDERFSALDVRVVRYDNKDGEHSVIDDYLEDWADLPPVRIRSGFEPEALP
jgi:hypothetical protein